VARPAIAVAVVAELAAAVVRVAGYDGETAR
jgi:hypothetical protein